MLSVPPKAPGIETEHSRYAMNNGWLVYRINQVGTWNARVFSGVRSLLALEMETGRRCHQLVQRTFWIAKGSLFCFCTLVLKSTGWLPSWLGGIRWASVLAGSSLAMFLAHLDHVPSTLPLGSPGNRTDTEAPSSIECFSTHTVIPKKKKKRTKQLQKTEQLAQSLLFFLWQNGEWEWGKDRGSVQSLSALLEESWLATQ